MKTVRVVQKQTALYQPLCNAPVLQVALFKFHNRNTKELVEEHKEIIQNKDNFVFIQKVLVSG